MIRRRAAALGLVAALLVSACSDDDGGEPAVVPDVTTTTSEQPTTTGDGTSTTPTTEPEEPASVAHLSDASITLTEVAELDAPTAMVVRPATGGFYVAERGGAVRPLVVTPVGGGTQVEVGEPIIEVLTTTDGERGLLGLAFSDDDRLVLSYTDPDGDTQVEVHVMDGESVLPDSRLSIFSTEQPYANHNGGHVAFGPDGHLYLGLGDGGGGGDPLRTAQDPSNVLGSLLRFDPDDLEAAPEIWAIGLRNPWRFSWDRASGDLWIADVGQDAVEEVTVLFADGPDDAPGEGANLGWPIFEGSLPFEGGPEPEGYVAPVFDYERGPGCSITGGFVSRGDALATLRGAYLYSDYCDPTIRALLLDEDGELIDERSLDVEVPEGQVVSFAEGADGELFVLSLGGGIYRIDPA